MRTFEELVAKMPATVEKYGERQPGNCSRCHADGLVLGTMVCAGCYCRIVDAGLRATSKRSRASTAQLSKRLAVLVALRGSVAVAEVESDHGETVAANTIEAAIGNGWIVEQDDELTPTGSLPNTAAASKARKTLAEREELPESSGLAQALADYVATQNAPVSKADAAAALGIGPGSLNRTLVLAKRQGLVQTITGGRRARGIVSTPSTN